MNRRSLLLLALVLLLALAAFAPPAPAEDNGPIVQTTVRGVLEKGAFADVAVWSEGEFASSATYVEPHKFASGMKCVMVNGTVPYSNGRFTGERGGRFLER